MLERFIQEIRRREKPVRIFPNMGSAYRLVGALFAETHEEWSTGRQQLNMDEYFEWKAGLSEKKPSDDKTGETTVAEEKTAQSVTVPT